MVRPALVSAAWIRAVISDNDIGAQIGPPVAKGKIDGARQAGKMEPMRWDVMEEIEAREAELVALTQALIQIPTLNPPGRYYREICELLAARLGKRGFRCELVRAEGSPGDSERWPRWNLVARREGPHSGPCVHFNSHTDVVEVGQGWTMDPFQGLVANGRVYGRGACDMKGGLAASVIASRTRISSTPLSIPMAVA